MGGFLLGTTMNKKVFKTMIALVVIFLIALYVLKIFFPEQFVMSIENETIITIGNYIDSNAWAYYLFGIATSFLTYWLYLCAVCKRWYLNWWQCLIVLAVIGASIGFNFIDVNLCSALNYSSFIFLPFIFKAELKPVAIVFTTHIFAQFLTLSIRNLPIYMNAVNSLIVNIVGFETYLWLFLFYIYYNYKRKE